MNKQDGPKLKKHHKVILVLLGLAALTVVVSVVVIESKKKAVSKLNTDKMASKASAVSLLTSGDPTSKPQIPVKSGSPLPGANPRSIMKMLPPQLQSVFKNKVNV